MLVLHLQGAQDGLVSVALEHQMVHFARVMLPLYHLPNNRHGFIYPFVCVVIKFQLEISKVH
jgi:hypothetical protein